MDVTTGRVYTIPAVDLALHGRIPLFIERSYSTARVDRDIGLGYGWSHSLAWEIELRQRTLLIWKPDGTFIRLDIPPTGEVIPVEGGMYFARQEEGYALTLDNGSMLIFRAVEKVRGAIPLSRIADRAGNSIELRYEAGLLHTVIDSVGRVIRVRRHQDGHIAAFEVRNAAAQGRWVAFRRYEYDTHGDLVAAIDALGCRSTFAYQDHYLTGRTYPGGLRVSFRYDSSHRCVETWAEHPGRADPSLAAGSPEFLADGTTRALGVLHCAITYGDGFTEVADSRQIRRYHVNGFGAVDLSTWGPSAHRLEYDALGNITAYVDPTGARWAWQRDADGRVIAAVDPLGAVTRYESDPAGQLVAEADPLGNEIRYEMTPFGKLLRAHDASGLLVEYSYDKHGQLVSATLPNGGVTRFVLDEHANRIEVHEPDGSMRRIAYDFLGRPVAVRDERGFETRYGYDERGALVAIHLPDGGVHTFDYDEDGNLARLTNADGARCEFAWAGFHVVHELRRPDGSRLRLRYDREGDLVTVINDAGEVHRIVRDSGGRIVEERTFDGRTLRYGHDAMGRVTSIENGCGERTQLVYDLAGRLTDRVYPDDTKDHFEYDAMGRVVLAENPAASCAFSYDERGRCVEERSTVLGATIWVRSGYDGLGRRVARETSLGYVERIARDPSGAPLELTLGGTEALRLRGDAMGAELERGLPLGGVIRHEHDALGRVVRRSVAAALDRPLRPGEPAWVGRPLHLVHDRAYALSHAGVLLEAIDVDTKRTRYEHDACGRIVARIRERSTGERYRYDGDGNRYGAPGDTSTYGPGGRLLAHGDMGYAYDGEARRVEKRRRMPDGGTERWRYEWGNHGLLDRAVGPDGRVVRFAYDPFGRRVWKEVSSPTGQRMLTRFVWDADVLVHESQESQDEAGAPIVERRTYVFRPETPFPLAHRDERVDGGGRREGGWVHYVNDHAERPELLVDGAGRILAELNPAVWGDVAPRPGAEADTPLRFPGQYADVETGLFYNRYRYYDPAEGQYISADPLGLAGGLEPFAYATNAPLLRIDPSGLVWSTVSGRAGSFERGSQGTYPFGDPERDPGNIHPIVQQAMPPNMGTERQPLYPDRDRRPPTTCAEPRALTAYIRQWERDNNGGRPLDPENPRDHERIRECLGSIRSVRAREEDGTPRAPCANCSQTLANLNARWGAPRTDGNGIIPGYGPPGERGGRSNWSRPDPAWLRAAMASDTGTFTPMVGYGQPARRR
ncbi:RHS repeat-associated core domain-containing protein [Sorangium sp. So ce394]|uniref:RHS repeat-associated core domain-containing protein n=1 Tax=Sorangium sp. So ce394 TaxID=3133310 RepID=UPI003F5CA7F6